MYYPRSFLKFILLGFLLVSLPLLYALGELILSLDQLQTQGREAVQQAAQAGRASRQLFEQTGTLERIVRQHLILEDSALLDDYDRVRQEFRSTAAQLALLPLDPEPLAALAALSDSEVRLRGLLAMPQRSAETQAQLAEGYARLADGARTMLTATNRLTESAIERLQEIATQGRQKWLYLALATAAIALALAILFAVLIARPIRQLDQAIRRMGTADFGHRIEVNGPQDLRYLGQRLEWLRSRLHDLEEQQNRFLRHVSHELKTPLTAVREGAELLRDNVGGKLSPEQREIVGIVRQNTLSLQKLIEDLLNYHQTRALEPQAAGSVSHVRGGAARAERAQARGAGANGDVRAATGARAGDRRRRQAAHHRRQSRVQRDQVLAAFGVDRGRARHRARLCRAGRRRLRPRHRPQERERIFDSFYQGAPPVDGRVKGSGLGLAIAREYALAHGGRIEVRDRADHEPGAHFRLWLPLAAGRRGAAARPEGAAASANLAGGR